MKIKPGGVRAGIDIPQTYTEHLADGLIATDGVQYSPVATFGTTAVEVFNKLIDPGYTMRLKKLEAGFTQKFTNLKDAVGSLIYHWQAREEYVEPTGTAGPYQVKGSWLGIVATLVKGIGSLLNVEDTLSGYVPVASLPHAPVRVKVTAVGRVASSMTGKVKSSSYIRLVGNVIPGA